MRSLPAVLLAAVVAVALPVTASAGTADEVQRVELLGRFFGSPDAAAAARASWLPELPEATSAPVDLAPFFEDGGDMSDPELAAVTPLGANEEAGAPRAAEGTYVDGFEFVERDVTATFGVPEGPARVAGTEGVHDFDLSYLPPAGTPAPPVSTSAGSITCPVPAARFINDWGFPRSGGRTHKGNDLFAPEGSPIVAVADATIVSMSAVDLYPTTRRDLGGITVSYVTDLGDRWYNAHLLRIADGIRPGVRVSQGQLVGYVGRTGNAASTPPHNHIQWHPGGGAPVNPYPVIAPACLGRL